MAGDMAGGHRDRGGNGEDMGMGGTWDEGTLGGWGHTVGGWGHQKGSHVCVPPAVSPGVPPCPPGFQRLNGTCQGGWGRGGGSWNLFFWGYFVFFRLLTPPICCVPLQISLNASRGRCVGDHGVFWGVWIFWGGVKGLVFLGEGFVFLGGFCGS